MKTSIRITIVMLLSLMSMSNLSAQIENSTTQNDTTKTKKFNKYLTFKTAIDFSAISTNRRIITAPLPSLILENKKKNMHQFNLTNFNFGSNHMNIGFGYNYKQVFAKKKKGKIKPFIDFGADFNFSKFKSFSFNYEDRNRTETAIDVYIAPGFMVQHKKFYMEVSMPFSQGIGINQSYSSKPIHRAFEKPGFQIGMGLKF
ncbi:MAG: hypothetical protein ACPG4Z_07780 [Chitinophagales bacterium]